MFRVCHTGKGRSDRFKICLHSSVGRKAKSAKLGIAVLGLCSGQTMNCPSHVLGLRATGDKCCIIFKRSFTNTQALPPTHCGILNKLLNSKPVPQLQSGDDNRV